MAPPQQEAPAAGEPQNAKDPYSAEEILVRGGEDMSEQEKKMMEILAEKASRVSPEQEKLALAYMAGLADGARSVQSGEKAG